VKYLLEFAPERKGPFESASLDVLKSATDKLRGALKDGSIDVAYTKVGGGALMVVNSSSHEALGRILRNYGATDVVVTPLLDTVKVMEAYHEERAAGGPKWLKSAKKK